VFTAAIALFVLVPVVLSVISVGKGVLEFLAALGCAIAVGTLYALWGGWIAGWGRRETGTWRGKILACSLGLIFATVFTQWPLRAAYFVSRPWLDDAAERLRAGEDFGAPRWVGLFRVLRAEDSDRGPEGKVVCLWTDLTPSGYSGLVQHGPDHLPFNLWSSVDLGERWQYIEED
jgi:hypothetical protein